MLRLSIVALGLCAQELTSTVTKGREVDSLIVSGTWDDLDGDGIDEIATIVRERLVSFQGHRIRGGAVTLEIRSGATLRMLKSHDAVEYPRLGVTASTLPGWGERGGRALVVEDPLGLHVYTGFDPSRSVTLSGCVALLGTIPDEDGDGKVELVVNRYDADEDDYRPAIVRSASLKPDSVRFREFPVPASSVGDLDGDGALDLMSIWPMDGGPVVVSSTTGAVLCRVTESASRDS